ncbi:MAG TPA: fumarylacetoacetate hydrolase family protein, partial [Bryobacteraceae bacterium]|nr:fumarylacetoacetate hydrolase family protein [Bryobacteraceae bacterium]
LTTREDLFEYLEELAASGAAAEPIPDELRAPIEEQEVWAAGVTYYRSRSARMAEAQSAGGGDFYDRVYAAERPELFMKAAPHRVVGPESPVRIRRDSNWNVPEPELTLLVSPKGKILGYTIGNDMSSRHLEGENPLYLPQAKTYDRCCALGPAILVSREPLAPSTGIHLTIRRAGESVFSGDAMVSDMKRRLEELVEFLYRECSFPNGSFLLTGTGIVPPDSFTLAAGDRVEIRIDGIGTLANTVEQAA